MNLTTRIPARPNRGLLKLVLLLVLLGCAQVSSAGKISLSIEELDIREVMQMLSREQRINIFVADGISGIVSVNLYDMDTVEAVNLIAESAGFVVERRGNSFFVVKREEAGKLRHSDRMAVRSFKVQYAAVSEVEVILQDYISNFGSIKSMAQSRLLVVEDLPPFLEKIEMILDEYFFIFAHFSGCGEMHALHFSAEFSTNECGEMQPSCGELQTNCGEMQPSCGEMQTNN